LSLEHAILGFLTYHPMSGYDLKRYFDESVRHFWPAAQSQIYRTLDRMTDRGWVRVEMVEQRDRPDRKVHHLTDKGRTELRRWLTSPLDPPTARHQWLIQVFFAHQLSDEEILAVFEGHAERLRQRLAVFRTDVQSIIEERHAQVGSARSRRLWQFTLDYGVASLECELRWVEQAIAELRHLPPT
jgi:PadR family transcriptional regulator AphA